MAILILRQLGAIIGCLGILCPRVAAAQTKTVPDATACPTCKISVEEIVRLDARGELPTAPLSVVRDGHGRFWLTFANELAMVYDPTGRFVMSLRRGEGPGEFQYPWSVVPLGDSLLVQDRGRGVTVLGPDLKAVRSLRGALAQGQIIPIGWPDSVLLNGRRHDLADGVNPFHVASYAGQQVRILRSFGADKGVITDPRSPPSLTRRIAAAGPNAFWASKASKYALQEWSTAGILMQTLVRTPAWFPDAISMMNFDAPPPPEIQALQQDAKGLVWVFVSVAAPSWRDGYPSSRPPAPVRRGMPEAGPGAFQYEKLYRTTVEVLDPVAGRVVARRTLDNWIVGTMGDGLAAIYDTTKDGEPFVHIVRLMLVR